MVRIRLRRVGGKKQPSYRVVVTDQRSARDGRFIETVGNYNPRVDPPHVKLEDERVLYWLSKGAQPSDAVARMLRSSGIWDRHLGLEVPTEEPEAEVETKPESDTEAVPVSEAALVETPTEDELDGEGTAEVADSEGDDQID